MTKPKLALQPYLEIIAGLPDVNPPWMLDLGSTQQRIREHPALAPLLQTYLADRALGGQGGSIGDGRFDSNSFLTWAADLSRLSPSIDDLETAPLLGSWCAIVEDEVPLLVGRVSGHPHLREGARVRTSPLMSLRPNERWARSCNRFYRLGSHDPSFLTTLQEDGRITASAKLLRADRSS
ncbi:DUF6634 family protein [Thioclava nitratireducens]|uniref:DUF6634 family protein n=1 Tax=Thioclava nitratireducens TaxID=1915078 RepID=UPI0024807CAF|nr:DUF6634 family protein [Thioclava nitratireducens]WGT51385.1 hypothetical protein P0N61_04960 [Thioclava nitratireducens]